MSCSRLRLLAASSLLLLTVLSARAATRPRYGGGLRIELRHTPSSLDPAAPDAEPAITRLLFDTLITLDDSARPQPALAHTWEAQNGNCRWQFWLRHGVKLRDGSTLTASDVAQSLTKSNPAWHVRAVGESVVLEFDSPVPQLPAELALPRNAIAHPDGTGGVMGTGPFRLREARNGNFLLDANPDYWNGRSFLDSVEVVTGVDLRQQALDISGGKADLVEVSPEQARRSSRERMVESQPIQLIAISINLTKSALKDARLREALAWAIDRSAIYNVLLQKQGEVAGGLLPNWISGYAFLFPTAQDLPRARQLRAQVGAVPPLTISYDRSDRLSELIAERVALNAREAGITLQPAATADAANSDARLVRFTLPSSDAAVALHAAMDVFSAPATDAAALSGVYGQESQFMQQHFAIPIAHLPLAFRLGARVRNWAASPSGEWRIEDVWISSGEAAKP